MNLILFLIFYFWIATDSFRYESSSSSIDREYSIVNEYGVDMSTCFFCRSYVFPRFFVFSFVCLFQHFVQFFFMLFFSILFLVGCCEKTCIQSFIHAAAHIAVCCSRVIITPYIVL